MVAVVVANVKGGAGKTTVASHLAVAMAEFCSRVQLVDLDPQKSLTKWQKIRCKQCKEKGIVRKELIQVSAKDYLISDGHSQRSTHADLSEFTFIDTPPSDLISIREATKLASILVLPVQAGPLDLWALKPVLNLSRELAKPTLLVLNRVNLRTNVTKKFYKILQDEDIAVAAVTLGNRTVFADALFSGYGVSEVDPRSKATAEIFGLCEELVSFFQTLNYSVPRISHARNT